MANRRIMLESVILMKHSEFISSASLNNYVYYHVLAVVVHWETPRIIVSSPVL